MHLVANRLVQAAGALLDAEHALWVCRQDRAAATLRPCLEAKWREAYFELWNAMRPGTSFQAYDLTFTRTDDRIDVEPVGKPATLRFAQ